MSALTVVGGDLFRVALQELGDATQWNRIAALNNLNDPVIQGIVMLKLPAVDSSAGGGFGK